MKEQLETSQNVEIDFRHFLRREIERRKGNNPRYSIRAFARDIQMKPDRLVSILNGRFGISPKAALEVGQKIGLTESELDVFCKLVTAKHARNRKEREEAHRKLRDVPSVTLDELVQVKSLVSECFEKLANLSIEEVSKDDLSKLLGRSPQEIEVTHNVVRKLCTIR